MKSLLVVLFAAMVSAATAQVALSPATPAISPSPVFVPSSPAITPASASPASVAGNPSLMPLSAGLLNLQTNVELLLPLLASFNNSFDFVTLGNTQALAGNGSTTPPGNFSANFGTNYAANFGVNAAMPTGGSLFNTAVNLSRSPATPNVPAPFGIATVPMTRDTLRAFLVLQSDLQRLLPLLNSLNTGAAAYSGSFTNLLGAVPSNP